MVHVANPVYDISAASDAELRHNMNVEDEYFSAIENRDTAILLRDKQLAEQGAQLKEQGAQLKEQGTQLKEKDAQIKEQDTMLKTSVKMLLQAGVPKDVVAVNLGRTIEEIEILSKA